MTPSSLTPPWAPSQVPVPEGGRVWTGAWLLGPRGGRFHPGALSSGCLAVSGPGPSSHPTNHLGMALERPLVSRPRHASCDLVTRALMDNSCPCSVRCPRLRACSGASSVSAVTSGPPVCSPQAPQAESVHGSLGSSGSGLRRLLGHKFLLHQDQVRAVLAPGRPIPFWAE